MRLPSVLFILTFLSACSGGQERQNTDEQSRQDVVESLPGIPSFAEDEAQEFFGPQALSKPTPYAELPPEYRVNQFYSRFLSGYLLDTLGRTEIPERLESMHRNGQKFTLLAPLNEGARDLEAYLRELESRHTPDEFLAIATLLFGKLVITAHLTPRDLTPYESVQEQVRYLRSLNLRNLNGEPAEVLPSATAGCRFKFDGVDTNSCFGAEGYIFYDYFAYELYHLRGFIPL